LSACGRAPAGGSDQIAGMPNTHRWTLLLLGAAATLIGQLRFGIDVFAWIAPIFWLHYLRKTLALEPGRSRRRGVLAFVGVFVLTWVLTVMKIASDPVPAIFAVAFGLAIGLMLLWPYLAWAWLQRREPDPTSSALSFAAMLVIAEWLGYALTPFGTWGMMANAALSDLALLQIAALAGPTAIGFVIHALAAALEQRLARVDGRALIVSTGLFVAAHGFGGVRLAILDEANKAADAELVTVAAIATDSDIGGFPLPSATVVEGWNRALFERTRTAANAGAELVVWTEAATLVAVDDEPDWLERLGELARSQGVAIVAAYVVPLREDPPLYENVYVLIGPDGALEQRYLKVHPVPGEPAVPGDGPAPAWISPTLGRVSGAICYDYDFPALARSHARDAIDLLALPSSDWRGIDPIHTQMAGLRAIESGHSILRSTRFGLSAGIDPSGRMRGHASAFERGTDGILLVALPRRGRRTLYGRAGEWFVIVCAGFIAAVLVRAARR
jgi:apolipoprotein N-acyltransferase